MKYELINLPSGQTALVNRPGQQLSIYTEWLAESSELVEASASGGIALTDAQRQAGLVLVKRILTDHVVKGPEYHEFAGRLSDLWFLIAHACGLNPQIEEFATANDPAYVAELMFKSLLDLADRKGTAGRKGN